MCTILRVFTQPNLPQLKATEMHECTHCLKSYTRAEKLRVHVRVNHPTEEHNFKPRAKLTEEEKRQKKAVRNKLQWEKKKTSDADTKRFKNDYRQLYSCGSMLLWIPLEETLEYKQMMEWKANKIASINLSNKV